MHHARHQRLVGLSTGATDERVGRAVGGLAQRRRVHVTLDRLEVLGTGKRGAVVVPLGHGVLSPSWQMPP